MAQKKEQVESKEKDESLRCYLYSSDAPGGQVFVGETAIAKAKKDGWKDSPTKLDGEGSEDANE